MMRGLAEALTAVVEDLRAYDELTDELPDPQSVQEGWPNDTLQYPVMVLVLPEYGPSAHRGSGTQKTVILRFHVAATEDWRTDQDESAGSNAILQMVTIMDRVADRLDLAYGEPGNVPAGSGTSNWREFEAGVLAFRTDWQVSYTQIRNTSDNS